MKEGFCSFHKCACKILREKYFKEGQYRVSVSCNGTIHDPIVERIFPSKKAFLVSEITNLKNRLGRREQELKALGAT